MQFALTQFGVMTASQTLPTFVTTKRVKNPEDTIYMADGYSGAHIVGNWL